MKTDIFPIHTLNANITQHLKTLKIDDIIKDTKAGLLQQIDFVDEVKHISDIANIKEIKDEKGISKYKVFLSSAFCQFFWLLTNFVIKSIDRNIILDSIKYKGCSWEYEISIAIEETEETRKQNPQINLYDYLGQMYSSISLIKENNLEFILEIAYSILDKSKEIDLNAIKRIQSKDYYGYKTNSVYCFGLSFILIHELQHLELGHFRKEEEMQDEEAADDGAFWDIFCNVDEETKFSANVGILCALFSLLMINPNMESDGIHPREYKRIFYVFNNINEENPKYSFMLIYLFQFWAKKNHIKNFPNPTGNTQNDLIQIINFLDTYYDV